ncbi:MAG: tetratricopeptide repeat protein [Terriglobia bacterium]
MAGRHPISEAVLSRPVVARFTIALPASVVLLLFLFSCHFAFAQAPDPAKLFQDAIAAQRRGDYALAVREYQELIQLRPDVIPARVSLAAALISLGRIDDAIAQYRAALQQAPGNRELTMALGLAYLKKGDISQAADLFASLYKSHPNDVRIASLLGDCDLRLGRDADAVSLLAPLEAANPGNFYLKWVLGSALIRTGRIYEGVERVETVAEKTRSPRMYMSAAQANLTIRRYNQASRDVDAARRLNPQLPGLDVLDGTVMESDGKLQGAVAMFQKVLASNPNDFEAQLHLGTILYTERQLDAAKEHLDRALEINPASAPARYQLARVERAQGDLNSAVKDLEQVERTEPDWLPPHLELSALYYRLKRPQDGAREKTMVDKLRAEARQRDANSEVRLPSP